MYVVLLITTVIEANRASRARDGGIALTRLIFDDRIHTLSSPSHAEKVLPYRHSLASVQ